MSPLAEKAPFACQVGIFPFFFFFFYPLSFVTERYRIIIEELVIVSGRAKATTRSADLGTRRFTSTYLHCAHDGFPTAPKQKIPPFFFSLFPLFDLLDAMPQSDRTESIRETCCLSAHIFFSYVKSPNANST